MTPGSDALVDHVKLEMALSVTADVHQTNMVATL